jgi:hypothetical protein
MRYCEHAIMDREPSIATRDACFSASAKIPLDSRKVMDDPMALPLASWLLYLLPSLLTENPPT